MGAEYTRRIPRMQAIIALSAMVPLLGDTALARILKSVNDAEESGHMLGERVHFEISDEPQGEPET